MGFFFKGGHNRASGISKHHSMLAAWQGQSRSYALHREHESCTGRGAHVGRRDATSIRNSAYAKW